MRRGLSLSSDVGTVDDGCPRTSKVEISDFYLLENYEALLIVAVSQPQPLVLPRIQKRQEREGRRGPRRLLRISLGPTEQRRPSRSALSDGGGKGNSTTRVPADMDPDEELRFVPASGGRGGGWQYDSPQAVCPSGSDTSAGGSRQVWLHVRLERF